MEEKRVVFKRVSSSNVEAAGYDVESRRLFVRFMAGKIYRYEDVDKSVFEDLLEAKSPGRFLRDVVFDSYQAKGVHHDSDTVKDIDEDSFEIIVRIESE